MTFIRLQRQSRLALTLLLACALLSTATVPAHVAASPRLRVSASEFPRRPSRDALKWADAELRKMSLDEKIGQLISVGINATFLNQESDAFRALRRQVEVNHVGGIILFRSPVYESVVLMNRMQQLSRHPLLISADLEAGAGMRFDDTINFPWSMATGATGNADYARRQGELTAREARALGIQQIFAPVADVNNNAANPVINVRSYGEDPAEVGRFVAAFIEGAQSNGVIATAKHFPGHGDTAVDSHRGLPIINVPLSRLNSIELVPFRAAIKAGVGGVMTGHISLPQLEPTSITPLPRDQVLRPSYADTEIIVENATLPGTLSPVIGQLLRRDLGFDGIIVTDALDMSGLTIYFKQDEAAVRAVLAGADMLLKPSDPDACVRGLREAVRSGRLTEARIEESARKILAAKFDLGLVKQRITPIEQIDTIVSSREALDLSREIAEHAITLVRNDAKLLPLDSLKADARIFNLAITNGDDRLFIANPFVNALSRAGRRVETLTLDDRSSEAEVRQALDKAQGADIIFATLYGRVRSGQARSVGLPEPGARALSELIKRKAPVVGISFGNPYLLQNFPDLQTYVVAYGDMPSLQLAAARAVVGAADITGKLPITLPSGYARGSGIQLKAQTRATGATPQSAPAKTQ
ncbi:MAG: beta-N-acetylhexosaminidase [Blastocatellia bacterium]|jgi:beta-N-acetylhexosaminidase|nr:beta-N-acetylhexosaminidase [Blastocatellia bacterium]